MEMARKYSKTEWQIAGVSLLAALAWFAYEIHRLGTPEYQQEQRARLTAEMDRESEHAKLDAQRKKLAQEIQLAMLASLQRCADGRDNDARVINQQFALIRYAECLQEHKRQFGIK
jgi:hypothetical protein